MYREVVYAISLYNNIGTGKKVNNNIGFKPERMGKLIMSGIISKKRYRFRGSVLFTVTLVMMVMIILMLTAITLAGVANKRAFGQYHDDQTTATGRSMVETIVSTLSAGQPNEALGEYIFTELESSPDTPVVVNVNNGDALPSGFGTVEKLEFQYAGEDTEAGYYIHGTGYKIVKVTATVSMGNETTTYTQYVTGSSAGSGGAGGTGGFVVNSGFALDASTSGTFHGPSFSGVGGTLEDRVFFRNKTKISGGALYNSTVLFTADGSKLSFARNIGAENGLSVNGNIGIKTPTIFTSEYTPGSSDKITDIPYVYCEGTFYAETKVTIGAESKPINIYTGRIYIPKNDNEFYSDIYCYNTDETYDPDTFVGFGAFSSGGETTPMTGVFDESASTADINNLFDGSSSLSFLYGTGAATKLIDWAASMTGNEAIHSGDIYTMGSLKLDNIINIAGDVCVNQTLDISTLTGGSKINGNINVNGRLIVESAEQLKSVMGDVTFVNAKSIYTTAGDALGMESFPEGNVNIDPGTDAFTWPTGLSKDDITGRSADKSNKIVSVPEDARGKFYDEAEGKYLRSVNKSGLIINASSVVYAYEGDQIVKKYINGSETEKMTKTVDITTSCTMIGKFDGCTFNITPPKGTKIWINLYDVIFDNCKLIIDDSEGREVYLYIPQGENYTDAGTSTFESAYFTVLGREADDVDNSFTAENTMIITKNYYDTYFEGKSTLQNALDLVTYYKSDEDKDKTNGLGQNLVPDIYICSADNVKDDAGNPVHFDMTFINQCSLTAHIAAANADFTWSNTKLGANGKLSYTVNGYTEKDELSGENVSLIGSILVGDVKQIQNDFQFFYVDYENASDDEEDKGRKYAWDLIDGYVTY